MAEETRLIALIGDPVSQSLSPRMQNAAIGAAGIDATYIALRTKQAAFNGLIAELLHNGGACNITSPFKDDAFALPGEHTEVARRTRSVNCVWGSADRPQLDNTDVIGVREAALLLMGDDAVRTARIVGTGGSARSAAVAITDQWPAATVVVSSRDAGRAAAFIEWAGMSRVTCSADDETASVDLVVHARPGGRADGRMDGQAMPLPVALLDLNYAPGRTALVNEYLAKEVRAADGRFVLLGQGAAAFERFFGASAPLDVMRAAVEYALDAV